MLFFYILLLSYFPRLTQLICEQKQNFIIIFICPLGGTVLKCFNFCTFLFIFIQHLSFNSRYRQKTKIYKFLKPYGGAIPEKKFQSMNNLQFFIYVYYILMCCKRVGLRYARRVTFAQRYFYKSCFFLYVYYI